MAKNVKVNEGDWICSNKRLAILCTLNNGGLKLFKGFYVQFGIRKRIQNVDTPH